MAFDDLIAEVAQALQDVPGLAARYTQNSTQSDPLPIVSTPVTGRTLASYIDHTLLKADATPVQIEQLCAEAQQYQFASVCVNSTYVSLCNHLLGQQDVAVCSVVGFPLGAMSTAAKVGEAHRAIADGAREIDMVMAIGRLKGGDYAYLQDDIASVVAASHAGGAICKVIIETALLTDTEKIAACLLAASAQANFVKTSTGFASAGATPDDVALMRRVVGPSVGVKASGGIRTLADVQAMITAGATRIGASAGVQIMREDAGLSQTQAPRLDISE